MTPQLRAKPGVLLTAFVGCFTFGWLVERLAPGTRLLYWIGWGEPEASK